MLWLPSTEKETECAGLFQSACLQLAFLSSTLEHFPGNLAVFALSLLHYSLLLLGDSHQPLYWCYCAFICRLRDLSNSGPLTGWSHPLIVLFVVLSNRNRGKRPQRTSLAPWRFSLIFVLLLFYVLDCFPFVFLFHPELVIYPTLGLGSNWLPFRTPYELWVCTEWMLMLQW